MLSCPIMSNSLCPHGLEPTRLLCPWGFARQKYWNELSCPPPGDLLNPGIEPRSPTLQVDSLPLSHQGSPVFNRLALDGSRDGLSLIAGGNHLMMIDGVVGAPEATNTCPRVCAVTTSLRTQMCMSVRPSWRPWAWVLGARQRLASHRAAA